MADQRLATDVAAGAAIASIVVTVRRDRTGVMTVHVEPAADRGGEELVPASLEAYVAPGPLDTRPWPWRRRRPELARGQSAYPVIGRRDDDTDPLLRRRRLSAAPGVLRRSAIAVALAVLVAGAALALITSSVSRPSTALDPTTLTSRSGASVPVSGAASSSCSGLTAPAWINGLYGIYGNATDARRPLS
jgi:hypothetical protein